MPAPRQQELIYDPMGIAYGPLGGGDKYGGSNDVILSPEEKSRRIAEKSRLIAEKKAEIELRRAYPPRNDFEYLPSPPRPFDVGPLPPTEPEKKPNILLLVGVAVVGLLVIRKVLN